MGKTTFTHGLARGLGIDEKEVSSPTFALVHEYRGKTNTLYHFDMYRLEDELEAVNIGFEEMIADKDSIKFVEWAEKVKNYLPKHYKKISIAKLGSHSRAIAVEEI